MKSTRHGNGWRNRWGGKWGFFLVAVCGLAYGCAVPGPLDKRWPGYKSLRRLGDGPGSYKSAPVREGYLLTRKGDTLKGYTKIYEYNETGSHLEHVSFLPYGKTAEADIIKVPLEEVDYIRVKRRDSAVDVEDYRVLRANLWQELGREGPVAVCSLTWRHEEPDFWVSYWEELLLVSGKDLIEMPAKEGWASESRYTFITRFINDRYGEHLDPKFFKRDQLAIIRYILSRENEKIRSAATK